MRVQSTIPHVDGTGTVRLSGDVYELDGLELQLRLKDYIVRPVEPVAQADGDPAPAAPSTAAE